MSFYADLESYKDKTAIITDQGVSISYQELAQKVKQFSQQLPQGSKKLIFVICKNNFASLVGYLGGLYAKHTIALIDADINKEILDTWLECYKPHYIWQPAKSGAIWELENYGLIAYENDEREIYASLSLLLSTSGSTGSPKWVRLSEDNLQANAASISEYLKLNALEVAITTLPMHYSYGLSVVNSHLLVGATILLTDVSIVSREFWDFAKNYKVTSLSGVPYTYEMLFRLKIFDKELTSLCTMTQAGGRLDTKFIKFFGNQAIDFFVMYGQTEATARMSYLSPKYSQSKLGSIGKAIPGGKFHLIDENGNAFTSTNQTGELVYTGPNVMLGYAENRDDLAKTDELQGTLHTGDYAYQDEEGFFYLKGRRKRFIKIKGLRIGLDELEKQMRHYDFDVVCTGEDENLLVVVKDQNSNSIKKFLHENFKLHPSVVNIVVLNDIPKTSRGKIDYRQLNQMLLGE